MSRTLALHLCLVCSSLTIPLLAQKGLTEPRVGVEFKPPKGWVELPGGGDRGATLRLFAAPRALSAKQSGATHTPLLRIMWFGKDGDPKGDEIDGLPRKTPFRSLDDFARRAFGSNQTSVKSESAKGALQGQRVTAMIGLDAGDRMLIGNTFDLDDGSCAVCFEVLADHAEKLQKEIETTLSSLGASTRTKDTRLDPPWIADPAAWSSMDPTARATARRNWAETTVAASIKAPEAGFKLSKSKYWTVLSAADAGFTKKTVAAAEAARVFCATKLPALCKDPLPAVLRVFDSPDHYYAFLATTGGSREYDARRRELLFMDDPDNGGSAGYGMLFRAVVWQVLDDVDPTVLPALPRWLDNGIWEFMRSSRFDGKKIEFAPGDVENGRIDYQQRGNTMPALWDLIQESIQPSPTDGKPEDPWGYTPECARLLRWMWMHDGQKAFGNPDLLAEYLRQLAATAQKVGPDPIGDVALAGASQGQREEATQRHNKWRDQLVKDTSYALIPKEDVWRSANEKWLEFNKSFR